ncbi:MAG: hypothetical protein IPM84_01335 [Anaerolineae bacterium]|nr:hypothetical protein [Anaerolineae bacterium]
MGRVSLVTVRDLALVTLFTLVAVALFSRLQQDWRFISVILPLLRLDDSEQVAGQELCRGVATVSLTDLTIGQRETIGARLSSLGCVDLAIAVTPSFEPNRKRSHLLAYQQGQIAWLQGDIARAISLWRQGRGIDKLLLSRARQSKDRNVVEAMHWYEAAIKASQSQQMLAESITAYIEDLRGQIGLEELRTRLRQLAAYFGETTAIGHRLRGQDFLLIGDFAGAYAQLSQATTLGSTDAETWYLTGYAAQSIGNLAEAENAYRQALDTPMQINWRRPWHLYSLGVLLFSQDRLQEASLLLEEATQRDGYYLYVDLLSLTYYRMERKQEAQRACRLAREQIGVTAPILECERVGH